MKVAHFGIFGPHASGLYETAKDLIFAEKQVGIDARFIDFGYDGKSASREGLVDDFITTDSCRWACDEADIAIRHSAVPEEYHKTGKPLLLALHGRPENSFLLEKYKKSAVISVLRKVAKEGKYRGVFTFWDEYVFPMECITEMKVDYIPAPVNLDVFNPIGIKHKFKKNGNPNIVILDRWREDTSPFNLIFAAEYFKKKYYPDAKLHIYGVPRGQKTCLTFLVPFIKNGLIGEMYPLVADTPKIFRGADMVITPNVIATRVIRETMASGVPFVAPHGCKYTEFRADPRDYEAFAGEMKKCLELSDPKKIRKDAEARFDLKETGIAMKALLEGVLGE